MAASDALTSAPGGRGPGAPSAAEARLGTGVRFPFRPGNGSGNAAGSAGGGGLAWVAGAAAIRQSVETVLDTEPGERVMRPTFGCGLRRHLMAPNTPATRTAIAAEIGEALSTWEPRIRVTEVAVTPGEEPALVWIDIAYVHLLDLRPDNLVYPFYLR
ncbi:GPW/gp25 family protein [Streptomyces flavotricini]|uniref:GPW/gp25 family protein n=1 Tax=Streptomyces flavotricini TaxID=66888 RepID=A0ABS8E2A1_9ACTN|nr:GPW/gp25 family protein [Streptomyces flavotricini]MCC0095068.1 GPW/gp25 family protein [Streptomyces flavotricini]